MTGLDAGAAQEIAMSGLDFSGLTVQPTLAEGLACAMQSEKEAGGPNLPSTRP